MSKDRTAYYQEKLLAEKKRLEDELEMFSNEEHLSLKESTGELSSYDNHPADESSNVYGREIDMGLKNNTKIILSQVNDALARLETDRFGICQRCGERIKGSRLEAEPYANYCTRCQSIEEDFTGGTYMPQISTLPFQGFNDDTDKIEYDAEDAWQDVAQYGTSNSPQDVPETLTGEELKEEKAYIDSGEVVGSVTPVESVYDPEVDTLEEASEEESTVYGKKGSDRRGKIDDRA